MFTALQARRADCAPMLLSFSMALVILADAPATAPSASPPGSPAPAASAVSPPVGSAPKLSPAASASPGPNEAGATASNACPQSSPDSRQIVICAERPQGYRLNPDVMEAKRESRSAGRPVRPGGTVRPDCATVGPVPCMNAGVNLLGAAATLAQMGQRLSKGQEVGSMFQTDPHPDEYHLYLMAKARREQEEKEKAAEAWKKAHPPEAAAAAAAPAPSGAPASPPPQQ